MSDAGLKVLLQPFVTSLLSALCCCTMQVEKPAAAFSQNALSLILGPVALHPNLLGVLLFPQATVHQASPPNGGPSKRILYVKGAPDRLMPMCAGQLRSDSLDDINNSSLASLAPLDLDFWRTAQEELSSQGLRVLAICK